MRLLGMVVILMSGDGGVAEMRVDREQQRVFQGLAILLMGSMLKDSQRDGSNDVGERCCWVDISLEMSGVGVGDVILVAWVRMI